MRIVWTYFWKIAVAVTAVTVAMAVADKLLFSRFAVSWENAPDPAQILPLVLLSMTISVAALIYPVSRSSLRGARLYLATLLASIGIGAVLVHVEAALFLDISRSQLVSGFIDSALQVALVSVAVVALFGRREAPVREQPVAGPALTIGKWVGRVAICSVCYTVLYTIAGMLIWPYIRSFYETQEIIGPGLMVPTQLVRGCLYVLFILPLLRSIVGKRWQVALAVAVLFPVLAGAPGLMIPNPHMPDLIRPYHMLEITWSNFAYGLLVAGLFWNGRTGPRQRMAESEAPVSSAA